MYDLVAILLISKIVQKKKLGTPCIPICPTIPRMYKWAKRDPEKVQIEFTPGASSWRSNLNNSLDTSPFNLRRAIKSSR